MKTAQKIVNKLINENIDKIRYVGIIIMNLYSAGSISQNAHRQ